MFSDDNTDARLSNSTTEFFLKPTNTLTYYFVPFYALLFLIGTFGNGLVIISILRSSRLRTVTNTYLLNIAVADFMLLLSVPFLIVTILANGWIFGDILCKMYYNFIHINQYVSSLLLAALSFDRYLAVCHPIRAIKFRTSTKCALIIAGCWLISVLFLCPTWVFATVTSDRHVLWLGYRVQRCVIDFPAITLTIPPEIVFTYYAFLLGFLFPASMITTFYVLVLIRLHRIRQKHRSELKQRSHRKVTRVVLAVITVYFICWVPYWFLQIFITIDPLVHSLRLNFSVLPANTNMRFLKELTHLTTIIGYANNCLNPLLYVFLSDSFREEYLVVLKCFHPEGLFQDQSLHYGQFQAREITSTKILRKSMKQRQRRAQAMKKVKHSVAIDEGPSEHRTFSFRFHRTSHQQRYSSTTGRLSGQDKNQLELASFPRASAQFLFAQHSAGRMIDDGGVYCGD